MKRNVILLAICQAVLFSGLSLIVTATALASLLIAPDPAWATIPYALQYGGTIVTTYPASMMMQKRGRKAGFICGAALGIAGAAVSTWALTLGSFILFSLGAVLLGAFSAFGQYYRFAAAEVATERYRSRAISYVTAGGVIAAFIGPNLASVSQNWIDSFEFAGSYAAMVGLCVVSLLAAIMLKIPAQRPSAAGVSKSKSLGSILKQPVILTAVVSGTVGYAAMILIMTTTPLTMSEHGFSFGDTAQVIQWHVFAMFAPSFITGYLIDWFGTYRVMLVGMLALLLCCIVNLNGTTYAHFMTALVLLGVGWNFCFVGATSLLAEHTDGSLKGTVQGVNDFIVFFVVGVTALSSGFLQHIFGWEILNLVAIPFVVAASLIIVRGMMTFTTSIQAE